MIAIVNKEKCIGCGACEQICSEIFTLNAEGLAEVSVKEIDDKIQKNVIEARESCPVDAITTEDK